MATNVLDIEGTVCPISFVHDVLFPYALKKCEEEIPKLSFPLNAVRSEIEGYLAAFPAETTVTSDALLAHIRDLMSRDQKIGYLKALQGFLWRSGYESGEIKAPIYDDAVQAMQHWKQVYIYSSGSVPAQQLLFKYTNHGDLTPLIAGYFDTVNGGPKTEASSYTKIASQIGAQSYRFYSDNPKEIDAAHAAGWLTTFVVRPGNPPYDYTAPDSRANSLYTA